MNATRKLSILVSALVAAVTLGGSSVSAQDYPNGPVTVIIPYAAGGGTDVPTRIVLEAVSRDLGQQFVVDNRPGAGSTLGTRMVAVAKPDGYTLGAVDPAFSINPSLRPELPYDTVADFEPVTLLTSKYLALAVPVDRPWHTLEDLVAAVKADPDSVSFAAPGVGTPAHLSQEQLWIDIGARPTLITYGGTGPAITDLVGGQLDVAMSGPDLLVGHVESGRVRVLAVTGEGRSPLFPDAPNFAEVGYPNVSASTYAAMIAPAGTPKEIIDTLQGAIAKALTDPQVLERLDQIGVTPEGMSSEAFGVYLEEDRQRWQSVIEAAGIVLEE